jgi:hypothetical protein
MLRPILLGKLLEFVGSFLLDKETSLNLNLEKPELNAY